MNRKCYSEEFRAEAVTQVADSSHSVTDIAKWLDITTQPVRLNKKVWP